MSQQPARRPLFANLLHSADIFNGPIYLNIKGRQTMATMLGGILSIALVLLLLSQGIILLVQMFKYQNAQITQISEFQDNPECVFLNGSNSSNFTFGVSVTVNGNPIDMTTQSLFGFTASFNQYVRDPNNINAPRNKTKYAITFAPCQDSNFSMFSKFNGNDVFMQYNLTYAFCPVTMQSLDGSGTPAELNLQINGSYLTSDFEFLQFNLVPCVQGAQQNMSCVDSTTFTNTFATSQVKFNLYYTNNLVNPGLFNHPNENYLDSIYWDIDPNFYKVADIFLDQGTVQNFASYYSVSNYTNQSYYSIDPSKNREQMISINQTNPVYLQFNLRRSTFNLVTIRNYTKFQDILANIGGLSKSIMFIFAFIAAGYVRYKYQMMLSNEVYEYDIPDDDERKKVNPDQDLESGNNLRLQQNIRENDHLGGSGAYNDLSGSDNVRQYFETEKKTKQKLGHNEVGYFALLCSTICCFCKKKQKPKDRIAARARTCVEQDIDIVQIVQKLKEFDKLKMVLLNQDQREIFDHISKPIVSEKSAAPEMKDVSLPHIHNFQEIEGFMQDGINGQQDHEIVVKYMKLFYAYRRIMSNPELAGSTANKRLLGLMGDDVIQVLNRITKEVGENPDTRQLYNALWKYVESDKKNK